MGIRAPAHWGLGEIDGLLVSPGKVSIVLTDHLIKPGFHGQFFFDEDYLSQKLWQ